MSLDVSDCLPVYQLRWGHVRGHFRVFSDLVERSCPQMALTDTQIKAAKPALKPFKKADGKGLYIEVYPSGSKLWRLKYRMHTGEKRLALGAYPDVSLAEARKRRDKARSLIEQGIDPSRERQREKALAKLSAENSFEGLATEYIDKMRKEGRSEATLSKATWFLSLLKPAIGSMPVSDVDVQMLLAALRKLEGKGNYETAKKSRSFASRVFRYAIASGRATHDPATLLTGALITAKAKHYAAIVEPSKVGELLRAIDDFEGAAVTKLALKISPHVFVRPGELRHALWSEIDVEAGIWRIPAARMKARRPHAVPLSKQVIDLFSQLRGLTDRGPDSFAFPAIHTN